MKKTIVCAIVVIVCNRLAWAAGDGDIYESKIRSKYSSEYPVVRFGNTILRGDLRFAIASLFQNSAKPPEKVLILGISPSGDFSEFDVTDHESGADIFRSHLEFITTFDRRTYLTSQLQYGNEEKHSPNLLRIFDVEGIELKPNLSIELENVKFITNQNGLIDQIEGDRVFSFCDLCDNLDEAPKNDLIKVPQRLEFEKNEIVINSPLTPKEKKQVARLFRVRKKSNLKRAFWSAKTYSIFLRKLESKFKQVLK